MQAFLPLERERTWMDARFRGHDESFSNMGEQVLTIDVEA